MKRLALNPYLILLIVSIPAMYFLLRPGFYEPQDLHHVADIFQMYRAATSGQLPPRLGPDYLWGWGYPLFNLYYVLPFYIGAAFYGLTKSLTGAFEFVFVLSIIASVVGMYLFLREFFGKIASLAGSILYLYTPYRAVQVYVRGAMGEALAMAILPFVFWASAKTVKTPNRLNIFLLAVSLALLILSHNYLWLLTAPFLVLFCLKLVYVKKAGLKTVKALIIGVLLAAGLSCYWWLPAAKEFNLVSSLTPFLLEDHFPFIKQLLLPSWGYGASLPGPYDGMSFQIGIVNLAAVVLALGFVFLKRKIPRQMRLIVLFALFGFGVAAVMMNIRTLPIWKLLPIYQFVQFPWRLLFLTTFFSALLAAFIVDCLPRRVVLFSGLAVAFFSLVATWGYFKPSALVNKPDEAYLTRMFAVSSEGEDRKSVSEDYINWSEDYLLLPSGITKPDRLYEPKIAGDENLKVADIEKISPINYKAEVEAQGPSEVAFYSLYFPGWVALLDGKETQITQGLPHGQMEVLIPEGKHNIEFMWKETPLRRVADWVSLISLTIGVAILLVRGRKYNVLA